MNNSTSPSIMGILNCTPNSFSDGGLYLDLETALSHVRSMVSAGADIIDIGGESTKPGVLPVCESEELDRVIPLIEAIRQEADILISIDTSKPVVMRAAIKAGANIINDINALQSEGALDAAAELDVPVILMHKQGTPQTMQVAPHYETGLLQEINAFFEDRIGRCLAAGMKRHRLILDPGFGYGKTVAHNLFLLKHLQKFKSHQLPILLGVSRKSTLGEVLNQSVDKRLIGGIAVAVFAQMQGITMIRTHDVDETKQALHMISMIMDATEEINVE